MTLKRSVVIVALVAGVFAVLPFALRNVTAPPSVVFAQSGCSDATVSGPYAVTFLGWATPPPKTLTEGKSSAPVAAAGIATFDGAGNWSTSFTFSHNGDITSATSVPGTYTVNSNCTGTIAGVGDFAIVILGNGAEITGINTDNNSTFTIELKKQNASGCQNSTLIGNYAVTSNGFGTPPPKFTPGKPSVPTALAGLATFDGAGNSVGSFTLSDNGDISALPSHAGTYSLNSDCTGTFTDATTGVHFAGYVLKSGAEVFGVQTDVGTATIIDVKKQ